MMRAGACRWRSIVVTAVFACEIASARAQDAPGSGRSVFAPSPPASVRERDRDTPFLDINVTGRPRDTYPRIDGAGSLEIQNDYNAKSDDKENEINDLTTSNNLLVTVRASDALSVQTSVVVEDVKSPQPGQNRYFQDTGVFVETLGLEYRSESFVLFGGKFNPTFGVAWDLAPGIYGGDLADDYELNERVGFGGAVMLDADDFGRHTLTGQVFYLDTSLLSQSWGTQRGRTRQSDGGVSNTETLESFSITLDGEIPHTVAGLHYQLGVERQRHGQGQPRNERGVAAALYGVFELAEDVDIEPVLEWARIDNFEGEPNAVNYLTSGAGLFIGPWNLAVSYTGRFTNPDATEEEDHENVYSDWLFQISAGYEFENGLSINLGYASGTNQNVRSNVIGALLSYDFAFAIH